MRNLAEEAKQIFIHTLARIDIASVLKGKIKLENGHLEVAGTSLELAGYNEIVVIGLGKASMRMGAAIESLLGEMFTRGLLVTDRRQNIDVKSQVLVGGHPIPNSDSLAAGRCVMDLVRSCGPDSLIIFLISGGGSALVEVPLLADISLEDFRKLNQILIKCGASIEEINIVRKHISAVKGGRLGHLARNSSCVGLYVSDVNLGDLQSIASNPLLPDQATVDDLYGVIENYSLMEKLPISISSLIRELRLPALPREWRVPEAVGVNLLLLHNSDAINSAAECASARGFCVDVEAERAEGEYRIVADGLIQRLLDLSEAFPGQCVCLVSGGEVSCPVAADGVGGRNQEFVLYCAARLAELDGKLSAAVLSCGTDGIDGNSNAAGAVACTDLASAAKSQGLEIPPFIQGNDSHSLLKQVGGLVFTGPTGNNVRDLRIMLAEARRPA